MKTNKKYFILIVTVFTLIYTLATGVYYSYLYVASGYFENIDVLSEGFFYILNVFGILAVSFYMKGNYTKKRYLTAYSFSLLSCILISFIIFLPVSKGVFTALYILFSILAGATQGCYVFLVTLFLSKSQRCMGIALAASFSVIINAVFSFLDNGAFVQSVYALIVYLVLGVAACILLAYTFKNFPSEDCTMEAHTGSEYHAPIWNTKIFLITCIFIALSWAIQSLGFFFPFNGGMILGLSNETLRITNILGVLAGGYLLSKDKKLGSLFTLIILATPILYITLQAQAGITLVVFMLSYFFTGFLSIYRIGMISDMSDSVDSKGNAMTFFCGFGLIFGRLGEGIGALLGIQLSSNTLILLTVTSFILVIAVAFFVVHYMKLFTPVPQIIQSHDDRMTSFRIKYEISSREMDVLELLIDGNSNAEIADRLYVSENTVRFHVSNLLKKTGCKSRKEIASLFYSDK